MKKFSGLERKSLFKEKVQKVIHFLTSFKKFPFFSVGLLTLILLPLTGCLYQMPTDKCISTLPNTNNPHITRERPSFIPGQG